jgi:carbonic anhydrase
MHANSEINDFPQHMLDGYKQFRQGLSGAESERYKELAELGQSPDSMVIACCDSRAIPEAVFNVGPGEIFVVRNIANIVPPHDPDGPHHSTAAAIEFATQALKVKHVIVMGHSSCGGAKAALNRARSSTDAIAKWLKTVDQLAEDLANNTGLSPKERQIAMEHALVRQSLDNLRTFPDVSSLEEQGLLRLHGAWFHIATGELWLLERETGVFSACQ